MTENTINDAMTMRPGGGVSLGRVDQYELVRELGGGGFGVVYLALDTVSGVEVAVKGLPPIIRNSAEELERIRANFALVSSLHHPYIAAALVLHPAREVVYCDPSVRQKLRVDPGDTLMVMEYAPGVTLSRWRKQFPGGKVPFEIALQLLWQIAQALDYAHGQHIIHRDIKPSNVVVETQPNGEVTARLLDFGLAAEVRSSMGRVSCEIHDTSGTRPYMAPEQWAGRKQGPATDQYALAVLLCELLTGEVPFASVFETGDPVVMMTAVCNREVELPADCPRQSALRRALSKDPAARFSSCMEFIETAAESEQVQTQMTEPQPEVKPAAGRPDRWKGTILVIGIALTVFSIGGGLWYQHEKKAVRLEHARIIAIQKANDERIAREKAEEERIAREEAERKAKVKDMDRVIRAFESGDWRTGKELSFTVNRESNTKLQLYLGMCCDSEEDTPGCSEKNDVAAVAWYEKASAGGELEASRRLWKMYWTGRGVASDPDKALELAEKCAKSGDVYSQYEYGMFIQTMGEAAQKKILKDIVGILERETDVADAQLRQQSALFLVQCEDDRFKYMVKNLPVAVQKDLLDMRCKYANFSKSKNMALEWYEKAAQQGMKEAQDMVTQIKAGEKKEDEEYTHVGTTNQSSTAKENRVPCKVCNGKGEIEEVVSCPQRNTGACYACKGKGFETCWQCDGNGVRIKGRNKVKCWKCDGKGRETCGTCKGLGVYSIDCHKCKGLGFVTKKHKCDKCGGKGVVKGNN